MMIYLCIVCMAPLRQTEQGVNIYTPTRYNITTWQDTRPPRPRIAWAPMAPSKTVHPTLYPTRETRSMAHTHTRSPSHQPTPWLKPGGAFDSGNDIRPSSLRNQATPLRVHPPPFQENVISKGRGRWGSDGNKIWYFECDDIFVTVREGLPDYFFFLVSLGDDGTSGPESL